MGKDVFQSQLSELTNAVLNGKMSRREAIRRASLLGISAPVAAMLIRGRGAAAQDATPEAAQEPGWSLVTPAGLRTDLSGQKIRAVLAEASSPDNPWLAAAAASFTAATGIEVEIIPGDQSATDRLVSYNTQLGAGSSDIDVLQIDVIWPGILAQHAVDLSGPLADLAAQHFPAIVENNTVNGVLVGIPWFTDAGLLYYRQDLLDKYGLTPPTTWAELEASAKTIQDGERADGNPDFWGFVFQAAAYEGLTCNALEWQYSNGGGRIVEDVDGTPTVTLNNPSAVAAFTRAAGWVGTIAPEGVTTYQEADSLNGFIAGNAAFLRNWPYAWSASQDPASVIKGKIGVQPLPKGDGDAATNADTLGGWQMMVSKYSEAQDASIEYVKFMCSAETQTSYAIERSHLPTIASVYDDPGVAKASEFIPRLKDVFQGGAVARPSSITADLYNDVSVAYFTGINQILTGSDVQSTIEEIVGKLEDIVAEL